MLVLARRFLASHGTRYGKPNLKLSAAAERALRSYAWPGNVRELRNAVEQAVLLAESDVIEASQFPFCESLGAMAQSPREDAEGGARGSADAGMNLNDIERDLLVQALNRTGWNVTRAAQLLGVTRDTLRYRIEKYRLKQS